MTGARENTRLKYRRAVDEMVFSQYRELFRFII